MRLQPGAGRTQPDGSLKIAIELWPTANCFRRGHRLRLQVCSGGHPRWSRNLGTGEALATATTLQGAEQLIYHDAAHPSALIVPVTSWWRDAADIEVLQYSLSAQRDILAGASGMRSMKRRDFLKLSSIAMLGVALPRFDEDEPISGPPPASLGRIAGGWRQPVRDEAKLKGKIIAYKSYDDIIPLLSTVVGEAPWPSNPFWFQTADGYIHSAFVQPVENQPSSGPAPITPPGIWVQVSVPIAETRLKPNAPRVSRKIYYGSVYRAVDVAQDESGQWWYRLKDGIAYSPGPYVLATSLRYLSPEALTPISSDRTDKKIVVDVSQTRDDVLRRRDAGLVSAHRHGLRQQSHAARRI